MPLLLFPHPEVEVSTTTRILVIADVEEKTCRTQSKLVTDGIIEVSEAVGRRLGLVNEENVFIVGQVRGVTRITTDAVTGRSEGATQALWKGLMLINEDLEGE
eukprot:12177574-Prorocentrum_lima.AAC.1